MMTRRTKIVLGTVGIGLAAAIAGAGAAYAFQDRAAQLRATGKVGEQANGYMGIVGAASGDLQAQVDAVNIERRKLYTDLAAKRGAKIEEVAATTACDLFANRVGPGQYYRGTDGRWQKREGSAPVPRPSYCG